MVLDVVVSSMKNMGIVLVFSALGVLCSLFNVAQFKLLEQLHVPYLFICICAAFIAVSQSIGVINSILRRIRQKGGTYSRVRVYSTILGQLIAGLSFYVLGIYALFVGVVQPRVNPALRPDIWLCVLTAPLLIAYQVAICNGTWFLVE